MKYYVLNIQAIFYIPSPFLLEKTIWILYSFVFFKMDGLVSWLGYHLCSDGIAFVLLLSVLYTSNSNICHTMCYEIFCMSLGPSLCNTLYVSMFLRCANRKTRGFYHKCLPFLSTWCQSLIFRFVFSVNPLFISVKFFHEIVSFWFLATPFTVHFLFLLFFLFSSASSTMCLHSCHYFWQSSFCMMVCFS